MAERPHVTDLLDAVARGEVNARNELFERVYQELKRIARSQLRRSGDYLSVNPTTLLHEAWLKFSRTDGRELQGSTHFYNILSQAMRHVLTDIARSRVTISFNFVACFGDNRGNRPSPLRNSTCH